VSEGEKTDGEASQICERGIREEEKRSRFSVQTKYVARRRRSFLLPTGIVDCEMLGAGMYGSKRRACSGQMGKDPGPISRSGRCTVPVVFRSFHPGLYSLLGSVMEGGIGLIGAERSMQA
jgi:hypothetical protein